MKYTKEFLLSLVVKSISYSEVCRYIGVRPEGSSATHIANRIRYFQIDTSHFLSQRANTHPKHYDSFKRKAPKDIFLKRTIGQGREKGKALARALVQIGRVYCCAECGLSSLWNGKPLTLQVDHIDGNPLNNEECNLRFLCPNCHTQTTNFSQTIKSRSNREFKSKTAVEKMQIRLRDNNYCVCGKEISKKSVHCKSCAIKHNVNRQKIDWPNTDELRLMVKESNFSVVARHLGVSDNAVRKRLKNH